MSWALSGLVGIEPFEVPQALFAERALASTGARAERSHGVDHLGRALEADGR
jgi:hypothetical protein